MPHHEGDFPKDLQLPIPVGEVIPSSRLFLGRKEQTARLPLRSGLNRSSDTPTPPSGLDHCCLSRDSPKSVRRSPFATIFFSLLYKQRTPALDPVLRFRQPR
jgi:hypothetical protein